MILRGFPNNRIQSFNITLINVSALILGMIVQIANRVTQSTINRDNISFPVTPSFTPTKPFVKNADGNYFAVEPCLLAGYLGWRDPTDCSFANTVTNDFPDLRSARTPPRGSEKIRHSVFTAMCQMPVNF